MKTLSLLANRGGGLISSPNTTSWSNTSLTVSMGIAMHCHNDHANATLRWTDDSVRGNPTALPQCWPLLQGWSYQTRCCFSCWALTGNRHQSSHWAHRSPWPCRLRWMPWHTCRHQVTSQHGFRHSKLHSSLSPSLWTISDKHKLMTTVFLTGPLGFKGSN